MRLLELGEAVVEGVVSIPTDLYYGIVRTSEDFGLYGEDIQKKNRVEFERVQKLISSARENNEIIYRAVRLILDDFFENLPSSVQDKIEEKATNSAVGIVSGKATQLALSSIVSKELAKRITSKVVAQKLVKIGVSSGLTALLIQGLLERSSNASKRLQKANPRLYNVLHRQNLEPIYFLIEETLAPVVGIRVYEKLDYKKYLSIIEKLKSDI